MASMSLTLLARSAALIAWAVLIFGGVTTSGVTHLLLAVGSVLAGALVGPPRLRL